LTGCQVSENKDDSFNVAHKVMSHSLYLSTPRINNDNYHNETTYKL